MERKDAALGPYRSPRQAFQNKAVWQADAHVFSRRRHAIQRLCLAH